MRCIVATLVRSGMRCCVNLAVQIGVLRQSPVQVGHVVGALLKILSARCSSLASLLHGLLHTSSIKDGVDIIIPATTINT